MLKNKNKTHITTFPQILEDMSLKYLVIKYKS